jgi:hypothetical protein
VAGFGPDVAAFAAATSIGRSMEAPTATTMANPSATTIAHAPTFRNGSRSKSRAIFRSRTSELRYRPRRRIVPAVRRLEMTSARVRIPGLSVGVLPSSLRLCRPRSPPIPSRRAPRATGGVARANHQGPVMHAASYTAGVSRSTSPKAKRGEMLTCRPVKMLTYAALISYAAMGLGKDHLYLIATPKALTNE